MTPLDTAHIYPIGTIKQPPSKYIKADRYQPASGTPFKWRFAGGPIMGLERLLAGRERKVGKSAKIRNRYNQVLHLTQDTNGKVTNLQ